MRLGARATGAGLGLGGAVLAGAGLVLGLQLAPIIAIPIAVVLGLGIGMLVAPLRPAELRLLGVVPTTTGQALDAASASAVEMRRAMRGLEKRPLCGETQLDEELLRQCGAIEALAALPALRERTRIDGDVQTLFTVATEYLPTIVNLAIENDRMHASFTSGRPRAEIAKNVEGLRAQALVLGEVIERIESDVVRGISRDAEQHAEFLRMRFAQTGVPDVLDLSVVAGDSSPRPAPADPTPPHRPASASQADERTPE